MSFRREDELWKTVTSVTNAGRKKGRLGNRQKARPLAPFYSIGKSRSLLGVASLTLPPYHLHTLVCNSAQMRLSYPGLNQYIDQRNVEHPISVAERGEEESLLSPEEVVHKIFEETKDSKKRKRDKLHPLERGFHGSAIDGQRLGPPPPQDGVKFDDFQTYVLEVGDGCVREVGMRLTGGGFRRGRPVR